jgi:WD40 repeat protein
LALVSNCVLVDRKASIVALLLLAACASVTQSIPEGADVVVTCIAPAPTGSTVAVGCSNGSISLIDAADTRKAKLVGRGHGSVARLAWSADGLRVAAEFFDECYVDANVDVPASASWESFETAGTWTVWNANTGAMLLRAPMDAARANHSSCAFRADGERFVTWGSSAHAQVFELSTGSRAITLVAPDHARITCASWTSDGEQIVTGDDAGGVCTWNATTAKLVRSAKWSSDSVSCLRSSSDGKRLFAGGRGWFVGAWLTQSLDPLWMRTQPNEEFPPNDQDEIVAIDTFGDRVITTTGGWGTLACWTFAGDRVWFHDFGGGPMYPFARFDSRGERVATNGPVAAATARIFDARDGHVLADLSSLGIEDGESDLAWTAADHFLVTRTAVGLVVLDGASFERLRAWSPRDLAPSAESKR